ncbi:hypothetical protein NKR19_g7870 [Coniochaeta hoffmannii]|uniref:Uncharacterized protein n=1 Tax=Coniochaeta hoffmannii TaxID=91930 RepID=A0AA38RET9_9PEZI|nr:hypothetical protein NKR19_g7870 [Coniochaeta hoffmannii]
MAGWHCGQQICSHCTSLPSISITQLQRPVSFHALPHQQQFQHLFFASNGQSAVKGQRGDSGDDQKDAGSEAYDGGVGYGSAWTVKFLQGRFCIFDDELPVDDDDLE